jgi:hypothetical protein
MDTLSKALPDSDDGQSVVNTREIGFIARNERNAKGDGYCRNEEIESPWLWVSADGSDRGAQRTIDSSSACIKRNRLKGIGDPVIALLAGSVKKWIGGVQAVRQLGKRDGADCGRGCVRGNGTGREVDYD